MDSNAIYEALRSKIIHLELAPESVLNLSELAEEFGVSRTPIKEVLLTLHAEEWTMRQGSHFIVTPLSLERIREITEIRMVMEVQANVWAMERITPQGLEELDALEKGMANLEGTSDNPALVKFDSRIHHTIFKAARNAQLATLLERLLSHYLRFWLSAPRRIDAPEFFAEHVELINAIRNGNEDRVRQATLTHIRTSVAEIMGTR